MSPPYIDSHTGIDRAIAKAIMDDGLSLRKPNGMIGVPQLCETLINTDPAVIEGLGLDLDFSWADGAQIEHSEAHRKKKGGQGYPCKVEGIS